MLDPFDPDVVGGRPEPSLGLDPVHQRPEVRDLALDGHGSRRLDVEPGRDPVDPAAELEQRRVELRKVVTV